MTSPLSLSREIHLKVSKNYWSFIIVGSKKYFFYIAGFK